MLPRHSGSDWAWSRPRTCDDTSLVRHTWVDIQSIGFGDYGRLFLLRLAWRAFLVDIRVEDSGGSISRTNLMELPSVLRCAVRCLISCIAVVSLAMVVDVLVLSMWSVLDDQGPNEHPVKVGRLGIYCRSRKCQGDATLMLVSVVGHDHGDGHDVCFSTSERQECGTQGVFP